MPALQVDDIQGIILYGYGRLPSACFLLLAHHRGGRGKGLAEDARCSGRAGQTGRGDRCLNIAFTRAGLEQLGLSDDVIAMFAGEFSEGMAAHGPSPADPRRHRREPPGSLAMGWAANHANRTFC